MNADDVVRVHCPWCSEAVELWVDPETGGSFVEACEVCCRPWNVVVERDDDGSAIVSVTRA